VITEVMAACREMGFGVVRCPWSSRNGEEGKRPVEEQALLVVYSLPRREPRGEAGEGILPCLISAHRRGDQVVLRLLPSLSDGPHFWLGLRALRVEFIAVWTNWFLSQQLVKHALEV